MCEWVIEEGDSVQAKEKGFRLVGRGGGGIDKLKGKRIYPQKMFNLYY